MTGKRWRCCQKCGLRLGVGVNGDRCEGCASKAARIAASLAGPSLAQLVDARNTVALLTLQPSWRRPLTAEHIATIAYALGVLSQERLAAGDSLDAGKGEP